MERRSCGGLKDDEVECCNCLRLFLSFIIFFCWFGQMQVWGTPSVIAGGTHGQFVVASQDEVQLLLISLIVLMSSHIKQQVFSCMPS